MPRLSHSHFLDFWRQNNENFFYMSDLPVQDRILRLKLAPKDTSYDWILCNLTKMPKALIDLRSVKVLFA